MTGPVLTFHDYDETIRQAIVHAIQNEQRRYPGGNLASAIVFAKATRLVRAAVSSTANDGLMYRVGLRLRQMIGDAQ